jgi:hypothetical protein
MDAFWETVLTFVGGGWAGMLLMALMNLGSRDAEETHSLRLDPGVLEPDRPVNQTDEDHARH